MNENDFIKYLNNNGIDINKNQLELFKKYSQYLIEYNQKTKLTSIKTTEEIYLKHFYDSIIMLKYFNLDDESILDVGSGAGFPGMALKIMRQNIKLTVLDSNGKKTKFIESLSKYLDIEVEIVNERAEKYINDKRESFDFVVARAVSALPVLSELCIPFVKIDGKFIAYKGNKEETKDSMYAIETLGGELTNVYTFELPIEDSTRSLIEVTKKEKTSLNYPRLYDKIIKKPLQKKTF